MHPAVIAHCKKYTPKRCAGCPFIGKCVAPAEPSKFDEWIKQMTKLIVDGVVSSGNIHTSTNETDK